MVNPSIPITSAFFRVAERWRACGGVALVAGCIALAPHLASAQSETQRPPSGDGQERSLPEPYKWLRPIEGPEHGGPEGKGKDKPQRTPDRKSEQGPGRGDAAKGKSVAKPAPAHKLTKGGDLETAAQRARKLRDHYAELAASGSAEEASKITAAIERLWLKADSDTAITLMHRAEAALAAERYDLAINLLDAAVNLAPDYAEVWNRRAYAHYLSGDIVRSVGDLRRVLALDPNHYRALEAFGQIMKEIGNKPAALAAFRRLDAVHPFSGADQAVKELSVEVEGQAL